MSKELEYFQEIIQLDEEALKIANKEKSKRRDVMLHRHWLKQRKNAIEQALKDKEDQDRALKLIIEKGVDMELLKKCGNAVSYNSNVYAPQTLKIDDFVFLKEFVSKYRGKEHEIH